MNKFFVSVLFVLLLLPFSVSAVTYYIKNGGNDGNTGLSDAQAWATLSKITSMLYDDQSDTTVLLKRGNTWREAFSLEYGTHGASGHPFTIGAYGTGADPKIMGSELASGWTQYSGNIWRVSWPTVPGGGGEDDEGPVFFINTAGDGKTHWGHQKTSISSCTAEYDWYWSSGYLYVNSGGSTSAYDPDTRYGSIEVAMRQNGMYDLGSYLYIRDLEVCYTSRQGIYGNIGQDHNTVDNCYVHHNGVYSGNMVWGADNIMWEGNGWTVKNNLLHDAYAHNIQHMGGSERSPTGDIIENNICYNGAHGQVDVKHLGPDNYVKDQIIRYNLIYTDSDFPWQHISTVASISVRADMGYFMDNTQIYGNIIKDFWQWGILLEAGVDGATVYNNVIYGRNPLATETGGYPAGILLTGWNLNPPRNVIIKNNIFAGDLSSSGTGIVFWYDNGLDMVSDSDYNEFYITRGHFINADGGNTEDTYDAADWNAWKTLSGFDTHSKWNMDPKFINPSGNDFHLQSSSPAIDNGTNVGITLDFDGNTVPQGLAPDIGAFEFSGGDCAGTCRANPCNTYNNCTNGTGTCFTGYCCSGACSLCGNTLCEAGETCSSCPGDCGCVSPQLCCNDQCVTPACFQNSDCGSNPCRVYTCSNPGSCSASCSSQEITSCINDDGCCPAACDEGNDKDCGGPVAWYHFDEGSGTIAGDSSGNGNDGTINGALWTNDSISGNALAFDGVNDYINCGNNASLNVDYVTVSMWFKADTLQDNAGLIAKGDNSNRQYWIWTYQNSLSAEIDGGGYKNNLYPLQTDRWYHLAVTYNGSNILAYINGTEVNNIAQSTGLILTDDGPLLIGNLPGFQYFDGTIDEVIIYNRALTPEEILEHYNQGIGNYSTADLNQDGSVDILDLSFVADHFGQTNTHPEWNATADVSTNNEIDIFDIVFVASRFT